MDPETLSVESLSAGVALRKYDLLARLRFELSYARAWQQAMRRSPDVDVVVACNVPLFALARMQRFFRRRNLSWVLWHQDLYSRGISAEIDAGSRVCCRRR